MRKKDLLKIDIIMKSAIDLIAESDVNSVTMKQIARRADLSVGTLYTYFSNKDELLNRTFIEHFKILSGKILPITQEPIELREQFLKIFRTIYTDLCSSRREFVFKESLTHSTFITEESKKEIDTLFTPLHSLLLRGIKEGLIRDDVDMELLDSFAFGGVVEAARKYHYHGYSCTDKKLNQITKMAWEILAKRSRKESK